MTSCDSNYDADDPVVFACVPQADTVQSSKRYKHTKGLSLSDALATGDLIRLIWKSDFVSHVNHQSHLEAQVLESFEGTDVLSLRELSCPLFPSHELCDRRYINICDWIKQHVDQFVSRARKLHEARCWPTHIDIPIDTKNQTTPWWKRIVRIRSGLETPLRHLLATSKCKYASKSLRSEQSIDERLRVCCYELFFGKYSSEETCLICKYARISHPGSGKTCEISHIISRHYGGTHDVWNLLPLCANCNGNTTTRHVMLYVYENFHQHLYDFCERYRRACRKLMEDDSLVVFRDDFFICQNAWGACLSTEHVTLTQFIWNYNSGRAAEHGGIDDNPGRGFFQLLRQQEEEQLSLRRQQSAKKLTKAISDAEIKRTRANQLELELQKARAEESNASFEVQRLVDRVARRDDSLRDFRENGFFDPL